MVCCYEPGEEAFNCFSVMGIVHGEEVRFLEELIDECASIHFNF